MTAFSDSLRKIRASVDGIRAELERVRLDRLRLLQEREAAESAPVTDTEIAKRVSAVFDGAEAAARKIASLAPLYAPKGAGLVESVDKMGLGAMMLENPLGALSLLGLRAIVEPALVNEAKFARGAKALSAKVRTEKLAELSRTLHALEVEEEKLIRACEAANIMVSRRPDASPEIFLNEDL